MSVGVAGAIPAMLANVSVGAVDLGGELDEQKKVLWEVEIQRQTRNKERKAGETQTTGVEDRRADCLPWVTSTPLVVMSCLGVA
jgi:hypothetical protein